MLIAGHENMFRKAIRYFYATYLHITSIYVCVCVESMYITRSYVNLPIRNIFCIQLCNCLLVTGMMENRATPYFAFRNFNTF